MSTNTSSLLPKSTPPKRTMLIPSRREYLRNNAASDGTGPKTIPSDLFFPCVCVCVCVCGFVCILTESNQVIRNYYWLFIYICVCVCVYGVCVCDRQTDIQTDKEKEISREQEKQREKGHGGTEKVWTQICVRE